MMLCSGVGLAKGQGPVPLSGSEWRQLAPKIRDSSLQRPGALLGADASMISSELCMEPQDSARLVGLLSRGGQFAIELEQLESRGIWALARSEDAYPARLRDRLGLGAPPVLFGVGPREVLTTVGIAVVGSRDATEDALDFAGALAGATAAAGLTVISGGARGIDAMAMRGAYDHGGRAVGVLADSLERVIRQRDVREAVAEGGSALVTPFHPATPFRVGNAMARNRLIYCMSEAAIVVQVAVDGGGTRAGALEDLRFGWVPLYVRDDGSPGTRDLIERGGKPLPRELDSTFDARRLVQAEEGEDVSLADRVLLEVWPLLADWPEELTPVAVAERFDLSPAQSRSWLDRAVELGLARRPERALRFIVVQGTVEDESRSDVEPDLFLHVWPLLRETLDQARSATDVAGAAGLARPLAKKWLERAVAESLAVKRTRPDRYERTAQPSLFEQVVTLR
jgi:predicted Rossmann fold nucleotide-binding protein DprA/Smf involved in DNA uptake